MKVTLTLAAGIPTAEGIVRTQIAYEKVKELTYPEHALELSLDDGSVIRYNMVHILSVTTDPYGSIVR